jgi:OmpA-OmpF porin, OOP family
MRNTDVVTTTLAAAALATALLFAPTGARAQFVDEAAGVYIGGGIGEADHHEGCSVPGAVITGCDDDPTTWKAYAGYQVNKWLAGELTYYDFGDTEFSGSLPSGPFSGDTTTWGLGLHAVGQIPIPLDVAVLNKISILGKIGTVRWDKERNSAAPGVSGSDNGWAFAWGLGLQYTFSERLGIRAEWERVAELGNSTVGEGDVDLWTVGVNFKF